MFLSFSKLALMLHSKNPKLWTCEYIRWRQRTLFTLFYICEVTTSIHTETGNTSAWHLDKCGAADSSESRLGQRLLVHYCHLAISIPLPAPFQSPVHVPHVVCPVWWEVFHSGHRERRTATPALTHGCSSQFPHCNHGLESAANAVSGCFSTYAGLSMP